jgi:Ribbon-helix-helix protein, copG family
MRKTQIYLDEPLDFALKDEAALRGVSKAELIRSLLRKQLNVTEGPAVAGLDALVGSLDVEPFDINETVYGPR